MVLPKPHLNVRMWNQMRHATLAYNVLCGSSKVKDRQVHGPSYTRTSTHLSLTQCAAQWTSHKCTKIILCVHLFIFCFVWKPSNKCYVFTTSPKA